MPYYTNSEALRQLIRTAVADNGGYHLSGRWIRDPSALIIDKCTVFQVGPDPKFDDVLYCPPGDWRATLGWLEAERTLVITARAADAIAIDRHFYDMMVLGSQATAFVPPNTDVDVDYVTGRVINFATLHGQYDRLEGLLTLEAAARWRTVGSA